MPIAFAMGGTALVMFFLVGIKFPYFARGLSTTLDSFAYLAIPFFVLAGGIMQYSGISEQLIKLIDAIAGRAKASLGAVTILASLAFGVLTVSNMATMATIGGIMIPEMTKKGYKKSYSDARVSACSYLGTLIPHSVPGIMFALCAGCNDAIPTDAKAILARKIMDTGVSSMELASFVSPKWIPQMADAAELIQKVKPWAEKRNIKMIGLVPNLKGMERAVESGLNGVTYVVSVSENIT